MNKIQQRRLYLLSAFIIGMTIVAALILFALRQNINAFLTPTQVSQATLPDSYYFRLGGVVKKDSLLHNKNGLGIQFVVTDFKHDLTAHYNGILPDLFREGKGVVADGHINQQGVFIASQVLAKHD